MAMPLAVALADAIRIRGLRATSGRARILGILREAERPLTHNEVVALASTAADRATVFRVLLDLVDVGLACRIDLGDRLHRFEATQETARRPEHAHFICTECARVTCLPGIELVAKRGKLRRLVTRQHVDIGMRGICDDCA